MDLFGSALPMAGGTGPSPAGGPGLHFSAT
jgi:hypothetical protein